MCGRRRHPRGRPAKTPVHEVIDADRRLSHEAAWSALPILLHKEQILSAVHGSGVVVITGLTELGKSTQVPQFLLEKEEMDNEDVIDGYRDFIQCILIKFSYHPSLCCHFWG